MNLFKRFTRLIPTAPLRAGEVTAVNGTSITVLETGGFPVTVRGEAAVGDRVYIRNSVIEGPAPNLTVEIIEE